MWQGLSVNRTHSNNVFHLCLRQFSLLKNVKHQGKNKIKVDEYVMFEKIRKDKGGGGLMTAVHKSLSPVSVSEEYEEEVLVVEAKVAELGAQWHV